MREMKFRGRHAVTNKWVYGSLLAPDIIGFVSLVNTNDGRGVHPEIQEFCVVVPESVGQFTGFKDKNGVEIHNEDVVAIDMWHGNEHGYIPEYGIIKWYQPSAAFKWFSLDDDPSDGNNYWLSQADEHQREVIGNIYENPELLERS